MTSRLGTGISKSFFYGVEGDDKHLKDLESIGGYAQQKKVLIKMFDRPKTIHLMTLSLSKKEFTVHQPGAN